MAPTASELVSFPGAYSNSDPGLTVNLYTEAAKTETTYQIPGPPLYRGAAGAGSGSSPTSPASTPSSVSSDIASLSSCNNPAVVAHDQCRFLPHIIYSVLRLCCSVWSMWRPGLQRCHVVCLTFHLQGGQWYVFLTFGVSQFWMLG